MGFDTKYRPVQYSNVLGQSSTIKILRRYVATGSGFHQSYLFSGNYGSGKTTLGRIHARALMCEAPTPEGDPCDQCPTCQSFLRGETPVDFLEVDAATNSGKAEIQKILEEIQYDTFSGRRRLYLFDESHQLSTSALDAMLKPLEECHAGSNEKKLVCIFCTTEPEKMRDTVLSRCAPTFIVRPVPVEEIAGRLAWVCEQEQIGYEKEALEIIVGATECHIRDALKALEGVSLLGDVNKENVREYLQLDLNDELLSILELIGADQQNMLDKAQMVLERVSPLTFYIKMSELAMRAYQESIGALRTPFHLNRERVQALGAARGDELLLFVQRMTSRPSKPTKSMVMWDLVFLHRGGLGVAEMTPIVIQRVVSEGPISTDQPKEVGTISPAEPTVHIQKKEGLEKKVEEKLTNHGKLKPIPSRVDGVRADPRAVRRTEERDAKKRPVANELSPEEFCRLLALRVSELKEGKSGSARYTDLGSGGAFPLG